MRASPPPAASARQTTFVSWGVAAGVLVFLLTLLLRWVTLGSLGGDDHWSLWTAATFLKGDRPFQEFVDPGDPLYWAMSALAQTVVGYRPIGEIGLGFLLMSGAMALSVVLAMRASRSVLISLGFSVVAAFLLAPTKLYSYPKVFIYPMAIWLGWRYIDRPGWRRSLAMAVGVAIAWGYRHDHGAYVAAGITAAALAAHWPQGVRATALGLVRVGALTVLVLSPYFVLIQVNEGLISYFTERIAFATKIDEAGRRAVPFAFRDEKPFWFEVEPQLPVAVQIEWTPVASDATKASIEDRYGLKRLPPPPPGGWMQYVLDDYSNENLTALMSDRHVVSVDGLTGSFRQGFAVDDAAGGRGTVTVAWKPALSAAAVADAERRFHLSKPRALAGTAHTGPFVYDIDDLTLQNVTALHETDDSARVDGTYFVHVPVVLGLEERIPEGPDVRVQWRNDDPAGRALLESKYGLRQPRVDSVGPEPTFRYDLVDTSDTNVAALYADPVFKDASGFVPTGVPGMFKAPPRGKKTPVHLSVLWTTLGPLTVEKRRTLEATYHLTAVAESEANTTHYLLRDARPERIQALWNEAGIAKFDGVDDRVWRPDGESWFRAQWRRYPLLRVVPLPRLFHDDNAGVWLYYVCYGLPVFILLVLAARHLKGSSVPEGMPHEGAKMFAAATLMVVANHGLMRKLGYFPDHADVAVILGSWVAALAWRSVGKGGALRVAVRTGAVGLAFVSVIAAATYTDMATFVDRYGLSQEFPRAMDDLVSKIRRHAKSPAIDAYAPKDARGDLAVIRYLYECTRPEDRIFVTSDSYALPYYTERRGVGHIFWQNGFMTAEAYQRRMIDLMEREPVPIVFGVGNEKPLDNLNQYPLVREYVDKRFTNRHAVLQDQLAGRVLWVLADSRRTPTGTYPSLGLPCFR